MTRFNFQRTVADLGAHGTARIDNFLDVNGVESLRAEIGDYYFASDAERRGRCMVNPLRLARGLAHRLPHTIEIFRHEGIRTVCQSILGHGWYVAHIVLDYSDDDSRPIINWHVDNGERGKLDCDYFVLKFQVYLDDSTPSTGATAYAPGTHHLISFLRARLLENGQNDLKIVSFHDVIDGWERVLAAGVSAPEEMVAAVDSIRAEIRSEDQPDAGALSGHWPAGSMMIFNDNGLHWAGPVSGGHRFVIRFYARPFHTDDVFSSFRDAASMGARILFAAVPGQRLRPLLFNV